MRRFFSFQRLALARLALFVGWVGFVGWTAPAFAGAASFTPLGDLPGGDFDSRAYAISADGTTVVGTSQAEFNPTPFRWRADTGLQDLGSFPGSLGGGQALGVSDDGAVVVGEGRYASGAEAFRWTEASPVLEPLGHGISAPFFSGAQSVSGDGLVVVGDTHPDSGFRWTREDGFVARGTGLDPSIGFVSDITSDGATIVGQVIQGTSGAGARVAFRQRDGGRIEVLDLLPGGISAIARAVSADGRVVVGDTGLADTNEAFRWTPEDGAEGLGILLADQTSSLARDVSADGRVIVGRARANLPGNDAEAAFVWTEADGIQSLQVLLATLGVDLAGWRLIEATGISADGRSIVGYGRNPNGDEEAFLAVIPEPSTSLLLGLGLGALARTRR